MRKILFLLLFTPTFVIAQVTNLEVKNIYLKDKIATPFRMAYGGDTLRAYSEGDSMQFFTNLGYFNFNKPLLVNGVTVGGVDSTLMKSNYQARLDSTKLHNQIALKKSSNDTILRTGYTPVGRTNDSLAAIRNDMSSIVGGEPVYLADSAAIKATIRALPITYLGIFVTAANSALLQGKDSIYIKANWGNEAIYVADSAYLKGNVRKLLALTDTTSELVARTIYVSMPSDPQTPGSDVTGTGTSLLPFATINKALSKIKNNVVAAITIQVDSGTFNMTRVEYKVANTKEGGGNLLVTGTLSLITNLSG